MGIDSNGLEDGSRAQEQERIALGRFSPDDPYDFVVPPADLRTLMPKPETKHYAGDDRDQT